MADTLRGTPQDQLDLTIVAPEHDDISSATRFREAIQTILDNIATLNAETIGAGSIGSNELATDSVITIKIKDGNITKIKMAANSVGTDQIEDDAVGPDQMNLSNASPTAGQLVSIGSGTNNLTAVDAPTGGGGTIGAGSIGSNELATDAVITVKVKDGNITKIKMAANSVGTDQVEDNAIGHDQLNLTNATPTSGQYLTIGAGTNDLTAVAAPSGGGDSFTAITWTPSTQRGSSSSHTFTYSQSDAFRIGNVVFFRTWVIITKDLTDQTGTVRVRISSPFNSTSVPGMFGFTIDAPSTVTGTVRSTNNMYIQLDATNTAAWNNTIVRISGIYLAN